MIVRTTTLSGAHLLALLLAGWLSAADEVNSNPARATVDDTAGRVDLGDEDDSEAGDAAKPQHQNENGDESVGQSSDGTTDSQESEETLPITPELERLRDRIRLCLAHYYQDHEDASSRSPWGVMHSMLPFGVDAQVIVNGRKINSIGWLCWNGTCRGQQLFYTQGDSIQPRLGPGVQGHSGQFLSMLALSRVPSDYTMKVDGMDLSIEDLVEYEKLTCFSGTELTFKLIGLVHYLESDATWQNENGERWSVPRLLEEELAQPINGATCGGTHRMMGFSYAVRKREKRREPIDGHWLRAKKYVDAYHEYTLQLQNPDGSFSTSWFRTRDDSGDFDRRIETTGHTLEWLVFSLPKDQLLRPQVITSVGYLTSLLWDNRSYQLEVGPKGHALHAIALFDERVFGSKPGKREFLLVAHEDPPSR